MEKLIIQGGTPLQGRIRVSSAKNAVLPIIAATLLASTPSTLLEIPDLEDVHTICDVIASLGVKVTKDGENITFDASTISATEAPYDLVRRMRASFLVMGPLLARKGEARIALPGGCAIGSRPIDLHLKAFEAMGATVSYEGNSMNLSTGGKRLHGASIYMDTVSVGATINTMLAAVKAKGRTVIENAAREPEIIDVATLLNNMGAHIRGAGTDIIIIEGVDALHGTRHQVIPDRIEAGTYISMAAAIGEGVQINNVLYEHLEGFIAKLEEMGVRMTVSEDSVYVEKQHDLKAINIKTAPYPGFATDLQQPITPLLLVSKGRGLIIDMIYEKRVNHVAELAKMAGKISTSANHVAYEGPNQLQGAVVKATDLRAGAALVIAGLLAHGKTEITNVEFILRGYSNIIEKLTNLGADIQLVEE